MHLEVHLQIYPHIDVQVHLQVYLQICFEGGRPLNISNAPYGRDVPPLAMGLTNGMESKASC